MGPSGGFLGPLRLNAPGGPCWVNGLQQVTEEKTGNLNMGNVLPWSLETRSPVAPTHFCRSPVNKLGGYYFTFHAAQVILLCMR